MHDTSIFESIRRTRETLLHKLEVFLLGSRIYSYLQCSAMTKGPVKEMESILDSVPGGKKVPETNETEMRSSTGMIDDDDGGELLPNMRVLLESATMK